MSSRNWLWLPLAAGLFLTPSARATIGGDYDGDGYVGRADYALWQPCLAGPLSAPPGACTVAADLDADGDIDLQDLSLLIRELGHLPMPLKDAQGNVIVAGSTVPYSGRHTCGDCHPVDTITNGSWFQDGRTDSAGNIDMRDDYNGDGRFWVKSGGRYGKWGQSFQFMLAAKDNTHPSQIDQTSFAWVRDCSGCHPGGGPGELDRDGERYYDPDTGEFGYEKLGRTAADVALDGDYSVQNYATGTVTLAPWNVTGTSGPDCLLCHRNDRPIVNGTDMSHGWRRAILATGAALVDNTGASVPAFAAAGTAGQGWFSNLVTGTSPPRLQIDYAVGLTNGSLMEDAGGALALSPSSVTWPPKDIACWGCHPFSTISGTTWFTDRDVHYRKFNRLNDADPNNDIPPLESRVCTVCHMGDINHNIGKGNSPQIHYRNDLDWQNQLTCRNCHLPRLSDGTANPLKHPDAPDVPGSTLIHNTDMYETLSCQFCHIPYPLVPCVVFRDITIPGTVGMSYDFYSADPLNPDDPDKSRWYPSFIQKADVDGVLRWFPASIWNTIYFADWDQKGTPEDLSDDIIAPIYTWRVAQAVGSSPLPVVTDDNGDGKLEINRPEEIHAYFQVLKGNDANGRQIAANPVLVKGKRVWYEDSAAPGGVNSFDPDGTGIPIEWYPYIWGMDHNVLPKEESLGYHANPAAGCTQCHRPLSLDSPVIDRLILVDPYAADGQPVYETVRHLTGLNPP